MGYPPPHPLLRPRLSATVCGLVTLSMACGLTASTAGAATIADRAPAPTPRTATDQPAGPSAQEPAVDPKTRAQQVAVEQARRTGLPVPVPELTTETDTFTAQPNGALALRRTMEPSRTDKTGTWRDLDPTLVAGSDGTVRPASTTGDLTLGGGGTNLLASMTNEGRKLTFTWPTRLPEPTLTADGALYPGVLPDVDLKVTASEQGGFSHTLIVKTPAAAKAPELATLKLGLSTEGLTVTEGTDGTLTARAADDTTAFSSAKPLMWDSRTTPATPTAPTSPPAKAGTAKAGTAKASAAEDTSGTRSATDAIPPSELHSTEHRPGALAATAALDATVTPGTLALKVDEALLTAPDTVFPVYIDPNWVPIKRNAGMWGWAQSAYPGVPGYGRTDYQPGVGYQHYQRDTGLERSFFQVPVGLPGKTVSKAVFTVTQVDSAMHDCRPAYAQPVYLHLVPDRIDANTNWINQPDPMGLWGTQNVRSSSVDDNCGNEYVDFDITGGLAPHPDWGVATFALYGNETKSTSNNGFKRFSRLAAHTALYIEYNTPPNAPTDLAMNPKPYNGNSVNQHCGYLGAVNPVVGGLSLYATVSDPDNLDVNAEFEMFEVGNGSPLIYSSAWISWGASGHQARADIPPGKLVDGKTYRWRVHTGDGSLISGWSEGCTFTVDATPPSVPVVTSFDYPKDSTNKYAGDKGTFSITATDNASGVDFIEYSFNGTIPVGGAARAAWDPVDGTWKIRDLPVQQWGTNHLFAQAVDRAGNRSQQTTYTFYAPSNPNATTTLGDVTGDGRIDLLINDDAGALKMYGTDTDPTKGGQLASGAIEGPIELGAGKRTWAGALTTHRGGNGITYDDLFVHANGQLYLYQSSFSTELDPDSYGLGNNNGQYFTRGNRLIPERPETCVDPSRPPEYTCVAYRSDWSQVKQILAPGDADGDGRLDLITSEDTGDGHRRLWLFSGSAATGGFTRATLLGQSGLNTLALMAPGDVTGDGLPDIWARDTVDGLLHQYASKKNAAGVVDVTALGNEATRTRIGSGFDTTSYPMLTSDGDLDGDGKGDLWARAADGRLYVFLGQTPDAQGNAFKPGALIADNQTPWEGAGACEQFPSAGDPNIKLDICGPILAKYKALGGPGGVLRLPTTGVRNDSGSGKYVDFQGTATGGGTHGNINWSPTTGAWYQHGGTRHKWLEMGGVSGILGYPVSDETTIKDGTGADIGWMTRYAGTANVGGGAITYAGNSGAHEIHGGYFSRWQAMGGPRSRLGFPATDVAPTTLKPGGYMHFRIPGATSDTGSLYWSANTGVWPVYGANRGVYAGQGWEGGPLGFPTSDEFGSAGGVTGSYEGGYIRWNGVNGTSTAYGLDYTTAAQRAELAGDFNGDGRADVLTAYDFGQETTGFFVSPGTANAKVAEPRQAWTSHRGWFDSNRAKYATGDFNGDHRDDVAALYGYADGTTALFTFLAQPDGSFIDGVASPRSAPGVRDWTKATLLAGDFNGDGREDTTVVYDHGNEDTAAYTHFANTDGTFQEPIAAWRSGAGNWSAPRGKYVAGDFDGNGRADIAALYGYGDGAVAAFTFLSRPDGTFDTNTQSWRSAPGNWEWNRVQLTAGDYNGDQRTDLGAFYDYSNADTGLFVLPARADGGFDTDTLVWRSGVGMWEAGRTTAVTGDIDKDGRADITAAYEYPDGSTAFFVLRTDATGKPTAPSQEWKAAPGTW